MHRRLWVVFVNVGLEFLQGHHALANIGRIHPKSRFDKRRESFGKFRLRQQHHGLIALGGRARRRHIFRMRDLQSFLRAI